MNDNLIKINDNKPFYKRRLFWIILSSIILIIIIIVIVVVVKKNSSKDNTTKENKEYIPYMCLDSNNKPSKNCLGGWFYHLSDNTAEYNANFAKSKNWNYVLLSLSVPSKRTMENIKAFRNQNISVHFMTLQKTDYLYDPQSSFDEIEKILIYVNNNSLDIQGIHIDVEPHATSEWKSGDNDLRNKIFQNYTKILENCRKAINKYRPNITFSAAVGWFYSSKTKKNEIIGGKGNDLVNKNKLDFLIPMIYDGAGNTLSDILKHSDDYLNDKANTVIGLAVLDHGDNLQNIINQVVENRKNSSYFYGISLFSNHKFSDWGTGN